MSFFYSSHYKPLNNSYTKKQPINGKATVLKQNIHLMFAWNKPTKKKLRKI